ncbi:alpha/beta hydrolase, partial [Clostridium perfringens]
MFKDKFNISNIPAVLWGEKSEKLFIAVHGYMSNKEDVVIQILAEEARQKGYQVLSFDLPEHGERKSDSTPCKVQFCVSELSIIMNYAKEHWKEVSLFACSMGAYFSLLAYKNDILRKALFLSPVVNMERIIENMMIWFNVTPERLQKEMTIETRIGQKLYWDYFCYVKQHPINSWNTDT